VLIPARGSSRDDHNLDPIIVPACHNGTVLWPEGQVDSTLSPRQDALVTRRFDQTEVYQTDARVLMSTSAASTMWYALIYKDMLLHDKQVIGKGTGSADVNSVQYRAALSAFSWTQRRTGRLERPVSATNREILQ